MNTDLDRVEFCPEGQVFYINTVYRLIDGPKEGAVDIPLITETLLVDSGTAVGMAF